MKMLVLMLFSMLSIVHRLTDSFEANADFVIFNGIPNPDRRF